MNRKVERGQATREQLVAIATRLFAERGYEATSIEAVLQESEVSRGALYHHFAGKDALFQAVHESLAARIDKEIIESMSGGITDPVESLRAGCLAWVRLAGDPVVQRIFLIDAPSVYGWQRWREIEEQHSLGMVKIALQAVADVGRLPDHLVTPFAHMLLAALNEIAIVIARADDSDTATREGRVAVDELLNRLLTP